VLSIRWRLKLSRTSCGGEPEAEEIDVLGLTFGLYSELVRRREGKEKPKLMSKISLGLLFLRPAFSKVNVELAHVDVGLDGSGGNCLLEICVAIVFGAASRSLSVLGLRVTGMFGRGKIFWNFDCVWGRGQYRLASEKRPGQLVENWYCMRSA
jgi:hypothetical protein